MPTEIALPQYIQLIETTDCTAIVGFNDMITFGVLKELRIRNIACPGEISVVGYSDVPTADLVYPPLTTVAVDHYSMGSEAARMLLDILTNPDGRRARSIQLPTELVIRDSTAQATPRLPGALVNHTISDLGHEGEIA